MTGRFEATDHSLSASIYVFHPALADAGVWFDSAQAGLASSQVFRDAMRMPAGPVSFAAGASPSASALRQVFTVRATPNRNTALAVVPFGEWIVSIELSTKVLTASDLDARLQELIAAVRWPAAGTAAAPRAAPVGACVAPLAYAGGAVALAATPSAANGTAVTALRATWCREGAARSEYSVYRPDHGAVSYVLLVNDTGGIASVQPAPRDATGAAGTYAVALANVDGSVSTFGSFSGLPTPAQVWSVIRKPLP